MFKIVFYVPESHLEQVKDAVFEAGAGKIGDYDRCCWQTSGQGQFRPLPGANPFRGRAGELERLPEYRVEMVCDDAFVRDAVAALRKAHPYQTPAFDVWRVNDFESL